MQILLVCIFLLPTLLLSTSQLSSFIFISIIFGCTEEIILLFKSESPQYSIELVGRLLINNRQTTCSRYIRSDFPIVLVQNFCYKCFAYLVLFAQSISVKSVKWRFNNDYWKTDSVFFCLQLLKYIVPIFAPHCYRQFHS